MTISATICSVAGPTPLVAARLPSSIPSRRSAGKPPTARAAVRKARMRNGFSPLSSRNAAICSSTWATAFLSMKLRTASVMAGVADSSLASARARQPSSSSSSAPTSENRPAASPPASTGEKSGVPSGRSSPWGLGPAVSTALKPSRSGRSPKMPSTRSSPLAGWTKQPSMGSAASSSMTRAHTCRSSSWA